MFQLLPGTLLTPFTLNSLSYSSEPCRTPDPHPALLSLPMLQLSVCVCVYACVSLHVCMIASTGESGRSDSAPPSQGHVQGEPSQLLCRSELMAFKGIAPVQSH